MNQGVASPAPSRKGKGAQAMLKNYRSPLSSSPSVLGLNAQDGTMVWAIDFPDSHLCVLVIVLLFTCVKFFPRFASVLLLIKWRQHQLCFKDLGLYWVLINEEHLESFLVHDVVFNRCYQLLEFSIYFLLTGATGGIWDKNDICKVLTGDLTAENLTK